MKVIINLYELQTIIKKLEKILVSKKEKDLPFATYYKIKTDKDKIIISRGLCTTTNTTIPATIEEKGEIFISKSLIIKLSNKIRNMNKNEKDLTIMSNNKYLFDTLKLLYKGKKINI